LHQPPSPNHPSCDLHHIGSAKGWSCSSITEGRPVNQEHGDVGRNLHASVGSGCAGNGHGHDQLAVCPHHAAGSSPSNISLRLADSWKTRNQLPELASEPRSLLPPAGAHCLRTPWATALKPRLAPSVEIIGWWQFVLASAASLPVPTCLRLVASFVLFRLWLWCRRHLRMLLARRGRLNVLCSIN
jgi:hypothetical protein